jgi:hypothetical protein
MIIRLTKDEAEEAWEDIYAHESMKDEPKEVPGKLRNIHQPPPPRRKTVAHELKVAIDNRKRLMAESAGSRGGSKDDDGDEKDRLEGRLRRENLLLEQVIKTWSSQMKGTPREGRDLIEIDISESEARSALLLFREANKRNIRSDEELDKMDEEE